MIKEIIDTIKNVDATWLIVAAFILGLAVSVLCMIGQGVYFALQP